MCGEKTERPVPKGFPVPGIYAGVAFEQVGPIHLWRAVDPASLLDEPRYIREFEVCNERMPYWSDLWDSAAALSRQLIMEAAQWNATALRAVEIGAGLGLAGLVLAKLGLAVTLTDAAPDALTILNIHLRENGFTPDDRHQAAFIDYFQPESFPSPQSFDLVVGTDILFETRNCEAVARTIEYLLAPGGTALIADPFRRTADSFQADLQHLGFAVSESVLEAPCPGPPPSSGIRLFRIT